MLSFKEYQRMDESAIGGTFVGVRFDSIETVHNFEVWLGKNNIPNPIDPAQLHSTVLFSPIELKNFEALGVINPVWVALPTEFVIWETDGGLSNVLVLKINSPNMISRHKEIMEEHPEAVHGFPEYVPHITLSYKIDPLFDLRKLSILSLPKIIIIEEYVQPIEEGFGK